MERLWTPWRLKYVTGVASNKNDDCVFCAACDEDTEEPLFLHRGKRVFVILNKYPYNNGHLMVVPFRHIGRMADADSEELSELISLVRISEMVLDEAYHVHGVNVGMNLGRSAGAGIPGHMHVHLVPRWEGDTNFMSVVGNTRVVPEKPADSVSRLRPIFQKLVATG
tara:strand:- start:179 stop:679 length:501 start_codon:yes stop_codon:yes gene_type:complete